MGRADKLRRRQEAALQRQNRTATFEITAASERFSGPLPPPEVLARYNDAHPGAAQRILAMAESQLAHRQSLEKQVVDSNCRVQARGPIFGFLVCMTAIVGGVYLVLSGQGAYGLAAIITALASLAGIFILGKYKQEKQLQEKREALVNRA